MKIIIFLGILFILHKNSKAERLTSKDIYSASIENKVDTASYPIASISCINLPFYYNKPINTFLADLAALYPGYILGRLYANDNLRMATRVNVYYGNEIGFVIVVKNFQFMNPFSLTGNFDINLFRQENIHRIELWNVGDCIHGCN